MAIDPNIPLGIKPQEQANPFDMIGKFATVQNALSYNKLIDQNTKNAELSNQQQQVALGTSQQDQAKAGAMRIAQQTAGLLRTPPGQLTPNMIHSVIDDEVKSGTIPQQVADVMRQRIDATGGDEHQIRGLLERNLVGTLAGPQAISQIYGTPSEQDTGGKIDSGITRSPMAGGGFVSATPSLKTASPDTLAPYQYGPTPQQQIGNKLQGAQPVTIPQPGGQSNVQTLGQVAGTSSPFPGDGSYAGGKPIGQTPPLGAPESAAASVDMLTTDRKASANAATQIFQLQSAMKGLQGATTGKGSQFINDVRSYAQTVGLSNKEIDEKIKNYDEANKYLTGYAANEASAYGPSTDSKIATALTSNASTHISNMAAQDVARANIGLLRMRQAVQDAFAKSGLQENQYGDFKREWAAKWDPRVFVASEMSPEQLLKFSNELKQKKQYDGFSSQFRDALKAGWITPQGGQNGGQ